MTKNVERKDRSETMCIVTSKNHLGGSGPCLLLKGFEGRRGGTIFFYIPVGRA